MRYATERPEAERPERRAKDRSRLRGIGLELNSMVLGDRFNDAMEDVRKRRSTRDQLKANPKAFLQGKGVNIPDEVDVEFTEGSSYLVCFYYYWYYRIQYCYYVS